MREIVEIVALVRCWSIVGPNVSLLSGIQSSEIQENMDVIRGSFGKFLAWHHNSLCVDKMLSNNTFFGN